MNRLEFDDRVVKQLEEAYEKRDMRRRRRLVREALAPAPGERILDVGCGPGFYVAELLDAVGPEGSVVGLDGSPASLAVAAARSKGRPNVAFHEADATSLPVADAEFDAALSVQVLEYVPDATAALREIHRALRPGGRIVVWDVDWATVSMRSADEARMRRVLAAWDSHLTHPSLPQTLTSRLREAGFEEIRMEGHAFATTELSHGHVRRVPRRIRRAVRGGPAAWSRPARQRVGGRAARAGRARRLLLRLHPVLLRGAAPPLASKRCTATTLPPSNCVA